MQLTLFRGTATEYNDGCTDVCKQERGEKCMQSCTRHGRAECLSCYALTVGFVCQMCSDHPPERRASVSF